MRIQTRLILVNILFITAIISMFLILFFYSHLNSQFEHLIQQSSNINSQMYKTQSAVQRLLSGTTLGKAEKSFLSEYEQLVDDVNSILEEIGRAHV